MTSTEPAVTLSTPGSSLAPSELSTEGATARAARGSPEMMETIRSNFPGRRQFIAVWIAPVFRVLVAKH